MLFQRKFQGLPLGTKKKFFGMNLHSDVGKQQLATHGRNFVVEVADKTRVWPVKNWISGALSEEDCLLV